MGHEENNAKEFKINNSLFSNNNVFNFLSRTQHTYLEDPKHLLFSLSRYKFVAKMFEGYANVLEIGCGDAFGTSLVAQTVGKMTATDLDNNFINDLNKFHPFSEKINFQCKDFLKDFYINEFNAAFCLDVLEHIPQSLEHTLLSNILSSLEINGDMIIGMPSLESQIYASSISKEGHVNCKTADELKKLMRSYFSKVFIFSMNDEVLHTGFAKMSHYIFALCIKKL
jgi:2-polyprenyl-3-methyl-5-hydroxy-6-metoxy-1,4-benzoquinol methylase